MLRRHSTSKTMKNHEKPWKTMKIGPFFDEFPSFFNNVSIRMGVRKRSLWDLFKTCRNMFKQVLSGLDTFTRTMYVKNSQKPWKLWKEVLFDEFPSFFNNVSIRIGVRKRSIGDPFQHRFQTGSKQVFLTLPCYLDLPAQNMLKPWKTMNIRSFWWISILFQQCINTDRCQEEVPLRPFSKHVEIGPDR